MPFPFLKGDPTLVNDATPAKHKLGCRFSTPDGRTYIYGQNVSSTSTTAGELVGWTDTGGYALSKDVGDVIAGVGCDRPAGVAVGTIGAGNYGYYCVNAQRIAVKTDGTPTGVGVFLIALTPFDGRATMDTTDNEMCVFGQVLEVADPTDDFNYCAIWIENN